MALLRCNGTESTANTLASAVRISQSSTYTFNVGNIYASSVDLQIQLLSSDTNETSDRNYDGNRVVATKTNWTKKGLIEGSLSIEVSGGFIEVRDAGPSSTAGYIMEYEVSLTGVPDTTLAVRVDYYEDYAYSSSHFWICVPPTPTITTQPSITSMSPASGQSTVITWSAATVTNQGAYSIYYQYFVGPSSTFSDSYHVGTTANLSATITEANILANCGSSFDGTCYVFVRAYWTDGTTSGGWTTPIGKAFTYTPHRTIKYYNGSGWVECIPYYYNGSSWVECTPYYYDGTSWAECSH